MEKYLNQIIQGDCVEVMRTFPDCFFDSVVTDPPYNLTFMGKKWDGTGIAYDVNLWKEVLRVLKPGGHLLSFGGSRTFHRMVCAIEDAGFEIRDAICWVYGQGFPKSLNIGKAVDKLQGNEREIIGDNPNVRPNCNPEDNTLYKYGSTGKTAPITKGNTEWEGWGTALKPAFEFICVARKPLSEKSITLNVLKWGTGGLNIDGCRIEVNKDNEPDAGDSYYLKRNKRYPNKGNSKIMGQESRRVDVTMKRGRFPANLILECICEGQTHTNPNCPCYMLGSTSRFFYVAKASRREREMGLSALPDKIGGGMKGTQDQTLKTGSGNVRKNKMKNNHPTVKPLKLMEHLVKLATPPKGIVLDPFAGSGTTCMACKKLGFNYIGIEKEEEYVAIASSRIKAIKEVIENNETKINASKSNS